MIVYYLVVTFMPQFGLEHNLLRFGNSPGVNYSDMNGHGHFLKGIFWFNLYWFLWTVVLLIMSNLFWVRGTETTLSTRWKLARQRISTRTIGLAGLTFIGIGCVGSWIYYNTCVLNEFQSSKTQTIRAAGQYEVKLEVTAKKLRADEEGTDQEIPCDDWIDFGIVDAQNEPLLIERKKLVSGKNQFTFSIDKLPAKAGIDPLNKLINRRADDNLIAVTQ